MFAIGETCAARLQVALKMDMDVRAVVATATVPIPSSSEPALAALEAKLDRISAERRT